MRIFFFSTDVIRSSPVLYPEYLRQSEQKKVPVQKISGYVWTWKFLHPERKSCAFKNIRIRAETGPKACVKLIFKITFKFRTSSFLYPTVLHGKIHVVTRIIDTVGKSLTKLSMRYLFRWWISERPRATNIVDLLGVNFKKTFTRVSSKCSYCSQTLKQWLH